MVETRTRRGSETRERLLQLAEGAILEKGFAATSIDELIAGAGITKSGFFYHFPDKGALAKALIQRYLDTEEAIFDELFRRSVELNDDPLHGFLVALKLFAEMMDDLPATHPGCLVASFCYQDQLFDQEVKELTALGIRRWRDRFGSQLVRIAESYPPKVPVDLRAMADMLSAIVEGGIIVSKTIREKDVLVEQILLYRDFVRLVFLGAK